MLTRPENDLEAIVAVAHLYRMILRRPVDRDGLLNHAARLMAGESLHAFASILLTSAEGRAVWKQRGARSVAASIWRQAGFGGRPDGGLRFARLWRHSGRDPSVLAAALVLTDRVRAVPLLPTLFPDGIDPSADDVFCGWEYRLWAEETDRLSTGGLPAGAGRRADARPGAVPAAGGRRACHPHNARQPARAASSLVAPVSGRPAAGRRASAG